MNPAIMSPRVQVYQAKINFGLYSFLCHESVQYKIRKLLKALWIYFMLWSFQTSHYVMLMLKIHSDFSFPL